MSARVCTFGLCLPLFAAICFAGQHGSGAKSAPFPPLLEGLGDHQHKITARDPMAQAYFDQGFRLMYAFNHAEAVRAFRAATVIDPDCAMAHWGIALSLGPNYNLAADEEQSKTAYAEVQLAKKLADKATPAERDYIAALTLRYLPEPPKDRVPLDQAYSDAMAKVAAKYPDDLDAAVLAAEAAMDLRPWTLWTRDGKAADGTEKIVAALEAVMAQNPNHPGANHFYIHAVEASPKPERALPSAERLGGLMPGAGHMVHMPAHIFYRLGRYHDASESNQRAIEIDEKYIAQQNPDGPYPMMYYPHNIHFLSAALMMEGCGDECIRTAGEVVKKVPPEMVRKMPMVEGFLPTRLFALARFGRWDEILKEPAPADEFNFASGMWHYAQGLARVARGEIDAAEINAQKLRDHLAATPEDAMAMKHHCRDLLSIARDHLESQLLTHAGKLDDAAEKLRGSIATQDALQYDEPPPWYLPMRQPLAAVHLKAGRAAEAEQVYRDELRDNPENGWSLSGLEKSLLAQGRKDDAAAVRKRLDTAWAKADAGLRNPQP